mmetsp:Transcript_11234/g.31304  ORF Transcript_11234/g.31304 Transcript_11234/m.31304 type:complete len:247 (-) Transcript_11234:959-1699(-)
MLWRHQGENKHSESSEATENKRQADLEHGAPLYPAAQCPQKTNGSRTDHSHEGGECLAIRIHRAKVGLWGRHIHDYDNGGKTVCTRDVDEDGVNSHHDPEKGAHIAKTAPVDLVVLIGVVHLGCQQPHKGREHRQNHASDGSKLDQPERSLRLDQPGKEQKRIRYREPSADAHENSDIFAGQGEASVLDPRRSKKGKELLERDVEQSNHSVKEARKLDIPVPEPTFLVRTCRFCGRRQQPLVLILI